MDGKFKLRGNMCSCGEIWFCVDMPESDPSHCPFCGNSVSMDGAVDFTDKPIDADVTDQIRQHMENVASEDPTYNTPKNMEANLERAQNMDGDKLCLKVCGFCTNETYFDREDADSVKYCPYCRNEQMKDEDITAPRRDLFRELTQDFSISDAGGNRFSKESEFFKELENLGEHEPQTMGDIGALLSKIEESVGRNTMSGLSGKLISLSVRGIKDPVEGVCGGYDPHTNFIRVEVIGGNPKWFSLQSVISIADLGDDPSETDI